MARKAGHQKLPSPEIPRGSPTITRMRSRRSPPPPPVEPVLVVNDTEEEEEEEAESRLGQSEDEDGAEDEENEEAREGRGEDINLQADYNSQNESEEDYGSREGELEEEEEESDNEQDGNNESQDGPYGEDSGDKASTYDDGRPTQTYLDPSLLLVNIEDLDNASTNVLDYFLRSSQEGDAIKPEALNDILTFYTRAPEGHLTRAIDPRNIADLLGISKYGDGLDKSFDPIFRKANLAAFSLLAFDTKLPTYFTLGGWDDDLARTDCYYGVEDTASFEFVKELRTQLYISAMAIQKDIRPDEHPNWPDKILIGAFCGGYQPDDLPFERSSIFKQRVKAMKLKGWDSEGKELKERFRKPLLDRIALLRSYTEDVDGTPTADLEGLREEYPYETFQDKFLEWLRKAYSQISQSNPSISWLRDVSKRLASDFENFHQNLEQIMKDPYSQDNPGSRSPSMLQPSRRTTGTSMVEEEVQSQNQTFEEVQSQNQTFEEVLKEPPKSSLRAAKPGLKSKSLDRETRKRLIQVKQSAKAPGKIVYRTSAGLSLPTSSQPQPSQEPRDRRSAPPKTTITKPSTGFNINESLAKAARQEEKENTMPSIPKQTSPQEIKKAKKKHFNESQEGRTSLNFDDDIDTPARARPAAEAVPDYAEDPALPEEEEEQEGEVEEGEDPPVASAPSPLKSKKRSREDSEEEDDDFGYIKSARLRDSRPHKRGRYGESIRSQRGRKFEPQTGASRPSGQRVPVAPPRPGPVQDRRRSLENSEDEEEEDGGVIEFRFVPRPERKGWSEEEENTLIRAIKLHGGNWAAIRDAYFGGSRSNISIKDKARNLKFKFLKAGKKLPVNFEGVTMDHNMLVKLQGFGIHYNQGDSRGTRL
ncbi:TTAGGG repeat binding factor [Arthrobotrys musiformis]|uniref:TTAGGG repeat binding factor n=1 Tax=Arthrobotrys musiformis TaxID=47236 RepID=A0AAV9VUD2_9PEZI